MRDRTDDHGRDGVPTTTHWGGYCVHVRDGEITGVVPMRDDAEPSPMGASLVDGRTAPSRVLQPMVRTEYLRNSQCHRENARGTGNFTPVSWNDALELVAGELRRATCDGHTTSTAPSRCSAAPTAGPAPVGSITRRARCAGS